MSDEEYYRKEVDGLSRLLNQERKEKEELRSKGDTATVIAFFLGLACFFMAYTLFLFDGKMKDLHSEVTEYQEQCEKLEAEVEAAYNDGYSAGYSDAEYELTEYMDENR